MVAKILPVVTEINKISFKKIYFDWIVGNFSDKC